MLKKIYESLLAEGSMDRMPFRSDVDAGGQYRGLPFKKGSTEIWYWNKKYGRDFMIAFDNKKFDKLIDPKNLSNTHEKLGTVDENDLEKIYYNMQGENWSPEGEARTFIKGSGTGHTSMSMGDIIVVHGVVHVVAMAGFYKMGKVK